MKSTKNIIELPRYFRGQQKIQKRIGKITGRLAAAQRKLSAFNNKANKKILAALAKGATTGDILRDQIIRCFGLDQSVIDKIMGFDKQLVKAKGLELLIAISYRQQWGCSSDPQEDERMVHTCWGCIFGTLSGGRFQLKADGDGLSLVLPFKRHFIHGFEGDLGRESSEGPVTIPSGFQQPDPRSIMIKLLAPAHRTGVDGILIGPGVCESTVIILVGNDVTSKNLSQAGCLIVPEHLRKQLQAPTPAEKIRAEGI
jgi:hypothetical protein